MSAEKSLMRKLRWSASGGGLILFFGLLVSVANQAAGFVLALAGLLTLVGVAYIAYGVGKVQRTNQPGES
jgi:hypothetical protein